MQNLVEHIREAAIGELFKLGTIENCWPSWQAMIRKYAGSHTAVDIINLGDKLTEIFRTTGEKGREQGSLSGGGTGWEALVCWYLNLCLLETRTVVIKHKKDLIPSPINDAITVYYGSFPSNTESDLIAITFPDKADYLGIDKFDINALRNDGSIINTRRTKNSFNYKELVDFLVDRDFDEYEIGIIQCKTNWNDNAQIPMLWDMIYSSDGFSKRHISVGTSTYSIRNIKNFTYSFVTVPTSKGPFNPNSTCVKRVYNLSGGNYWGQPTKPGVANSLKEMFGKNFKTATQSGIRNSLKSALNKIESRYSYFNLF